MRTENFKNEKHRSDVKYLMNLAREQEEKIRESETLSFCLEKNIVNIEDMYRSDLVSKKGFIIDTKINYAEQGLDQSLVESDSIFSYKFGVQSDDTSTVKQMKYTCNCDTNNVKESAGEFCSKCGTFSTENKYLRGWIDLGKFKVFNPYVLDLIAANLKKPGMLKRFSKGKSQKEKITKLSWLLDTSSEFNMITLQDRKVLEKFIKVHAADDVREYFLKNIDSFMTSKIPVVNKSVRFYKVINTVESKPGVRSHPMNAMFITMSAHAKSLVYENTSIMSTEILNETLQKVQVYFHNVLEQVYDMIGKGKDSIYREKIGGRRFGCSSKQIIESYKTACTWSSCISYASFGVMYLEYHYDKFLEFGLTPESEYRIRNMCPAKQDYKMLEDVLDWLQVNNLAWYVASREPVIYPRSIIGLFVHKLIVSHVTRVSDVALEKSSHGDKDGDFYQLAALHPSIRLSFAFAFAPRRDIFDIVTCTIDPGFELPESIYYNTYTIFKTSTTKEEMIVGRVENFKKYKRNSYDKPYDVGKIKKEGYKVEYAS